MNNITQKNLHINRLIIVLWVILTIINIDKAFHIDDTFYLEAAKWIQSNPFKPMTGLVNWSDDLIPFYKHNPPPLFAYLVAFTGCIWGYSEIAIHLLISFFTFLSLSLFLAICKQIQAKNTSVLLFLFAFCPAFIVNQNAMTDVPILSVLLAAFLFLLKRNYGTSLLLFSLGMLIKYAILPLFGVIFLIIIIRKKWNKLIYIIIPIGAIAIWSTFNYWEFGGVHLLQRAAGHFEAIRFLDLLACLGAISVFSLSWLYCLFPVKKIKIGIFSFVILCVICFVLFLTDTMLEHQITPILNMLFLVNGMFILLCTIYIIRIKILSTNFVEFLQSDSFCILLTILSFAAFTIIFAPFIATRHLLLIIPFVLLFTDKYLFGNSIIINTINLTGTLFLGLALGISDYKYAQYYKEMALEISLPQKGTIYSAGHWGWQWYTTQRGIKQYATHDSGIQTGDFLVYPRHIHLPRKGSNTKLEKVSMKWKEADMFTYFSVGDFAGMYISGVSKPTWFLSKRPVDTICVKRVQLLN